MYQKDYILRMLEMLAELIAGILGLIKKGKLEQASQALENAYQDLLKEDAGFFQNIPLEELSNKLIEEHSYSNEHLEILSELLYTQGELSYARKEYAESLVFFKKSHKLFEHITKESNTFSFEKQAKLEKSKKRIEDLASLLNNTVN